MIFWCAIGDTKGWNICFPHVSTLFLFSVFTDLGFTLFLSSVETCFYTVSQPFLAHINMFIHCFQTVSKQCVRCHFWVGHRSVPIPHCFLTVFKQFCTLFSNCFGDARCQIWHTDADSKQFRIRILHCLNSFGPFLACQKSSCGTPEVDIWHAGS